MEKEKLLPLFKWAGGKRREIPIIQNFYPDFVKENKDYKLVEPFAGAAAVFWSLNNFSGINILNDFDFDVINFFNHVKKQDPVFLKHVKEASELYAMEDKNSDENRQKQEENYYYWRNRDRKNGLQGLDAPTRAARFWIVNQLAFSGMRRFNKAGEFNVPYGHYRNLNSSALTNKKHIELLANTKTFSGDYKKIVENNDDENTFIFIDPPYTRVMKTYSADNEFGEDKQKELADTLKSLKKASFMIVIDKSELTERLYEGYIKHTYSLNYGVNIKNRFDTQVEHIIATNY